jgi:hypothetical protein
VAGGAGDLVDLEDGPSGEAEGEERRHSVHQQPVVAAALPPAAGRRSVGLQALGERDLVGAGAEDVWAREA